MKSEGTILIIDDEEDLSFSLKLLLSRHFTSVYTESNPYHIPRLLRQMKPDVILLDMNFSRGKTDGAEGLHWLQKIKELSPSVQVLMITAYSEVDIAVKTLKFGATDFLEKPADLKALEQKIKDASTQRMVIVEKQAEERIKDVIRRMGG